jgi:CheY-like chemotaxis protein
LPIRPRRGTRTADDRTVLLVDDQDGIVDAYLGYLAPAECRYGAPAAAGCLDEADADLGLGYRFLRASSGEEAIATVRTELAAGRRVQGGFFDLRMPGGIDGVETIERVRALDPDVLVTVVTAYRDESLAHVEAVFGPDRHDEWAYFCKPFTRWEVVQACRRMVLAWGRRRRMQETQVVSELLLAELAVEAPAVADALRRLADRLGCAAAHAAVGALDAPFLDGAGDLAGPAGRAAEAARRIALDAAPCLDGPRGAR